jgi:hypothetical protein
LLIFCRAAPHACSSHADICFPYPEEEPFQGVLRARFCHAQREPNQFGESHFSFPGEILFSFFGPSFIQRLIYNLLCGKRRFRRPAGQD